MNTNTMKKIAFAAFGFVATCALSMAADYTWDGGGADDNWTTGGNWGGTAPGASQTLIFAGTNRLAPLNNNTAGWNVAGIRFNANAGAFTLSGNSITLASGVTNNSGNTQTLDLPIVMNGGLTFNTAAGNIVSTKGISGTSPLRKEGLSTLTLQGTNTWSAGVYHLGGRLVYDYTGGGSFPTAGTFYFGAVGGLTLGNTATLEIKGASSASLPAVSIGTYTHAANKIKLGSNVALTVASLSLAGNGTANFDLTASGSSVAFTSSPGLDNGLLLRGTVTDSGGTGFATVVGGTLQRFTDFYGPLEGGFQTARNYTLGGNVSIGAANINTVTITNGGSLAIAGTAGLWSRALLMQEGAGDFTFNAVLRVSAPLFVHQYSTNGTLILNERIQDADANTSFIKTGPGAVRIGSSSTSSYTGATYVQGGLLELDGHLTKSGTVTVFDGATLSGAGTIGSASATALSIRSGGKLAGSSAASLDITGTLTLESDSIFAFTLGTDPDFVNVTGAVTLQSNAKLSLALDGAPDLYTNIYLLKSGDSITGNLVYNNTVMTHGTAFSLDGYDFTYFQDSKDIWVQAIPEPSAALLFALGAASLLLRRRRRI